MHYTQNQVTDLVTPARTLRDAAKYLTRYGWIQGCYYDQSATVFTPATCMVGAIGIVCYGGPSDAPAHNAADPGYNDFGAAVEILRSYLVVTHGVDDPYLFNDAKGRTATEIREALIEAADMWDDIPTWTVFDASMPLIIRAGLLPTTAGGAT